MSPLVSRAAGALALALVAPRAIRAQTAADTVGACWSYDTPDAHFAVRVVATGMRVPVSIAFLPDGRALVAERPVGRLSYLDLKSGVLTAIDGVPPVVGQVDGGLLDVVVHKNFVRNGRIYFAYSEHTDSGNATVVDVGRLDGNHLVGRRRLIAVHPYLDNVNQFGARLVLDHGYLYIAVGERDVPELAQDLSSDAGKILRLREDGSVPPDNPFVGKPGARPEIWSYGHRNPHGLAIDPRTGVLWEHEHGPRGGDEINLIQRGRNYGWPVITYGIEYTGEPVGAGITHHDGMEQPRYVYLPSIAPTGMAFYTGRDFARWRGSIFLGSLSYRHLNRVVLRDGRIVSEERLLHDRDWRIREVRQSPDGTLYLGIESGLVVRIAPDAGARCAHGLTERDSWSEAPAPSPRVAHPVSAYDVDDHRVVVLGSADTTWEWDGRAWASVVGAEPTAHAGQAMATDPGGGLVLAGGRDANESPSADGWHYAAQRWTALRPSEPSPRADAAMTFDLDHHRVLMRGGSPCSDRRMWSWHDSAWTVVDSAGPPARSGASMTYDPTTRSAILAGGHDCDGHTSNESWRWDGRRWTSFTGLPVADRVCLIYSSTRNSMLLFTIDSLAPSRAWQLKGAQWRHVDLDLPPLADASCAVDAFNQRIVLLGRTPGSLETKTFLLLR